ncbi:MAG TPA: GlsB/YeaQ/YmgE family stress response membrane protein [Bryobacteraceae bacterium]|nr:GlsB/YeaQ/YmgE family stress response membrane protein [Bryobacteraceae bacterium]
MSFIAWIILGLLAGFIGSKLVNKRGEGLIVDILLGIVGAIVGGWLFNRFGGAGVTGLNLYSLLVAVVGSVVVLLVYHALRRV